MNRFWIRTHFYSLLAHCNVWCSNSPLVVFLFSQSLIIVMCGVGTVISWSFYSLNRTYISLIARKRTSREVCVIFIITILKNVFEYHSALPNRTVIRQLSISILQPPGVLGSHISSLRMKKIVPGLIVFCLKGHPVIQLLSTNEIIIFLNFMNQIRSL